MTDRVEEKDLAELATLLRNLKPDEAPYRDELTGLPAKEHFYSQAACLAREIAAVGGLVDVAYVNVGNLKAFNARYGFEAGDDLLRFVARSIQDVFPDHFIAYFGDDRFVALVDDREVHAGITKLSDMVRDFNADSHTSIRAGVFRYWQAPDVDIRIACDAAKMACDSIRGRYNKVYSYYKEEIGTTSATRQRVIDRFDRALQEGQFQVHYQPIVSTLNNQVCEAEALVRWFDPEEGVVSPADFIPALEEARLIHRLDLHMLQLICDGIHVLERRGIQPCPVTVNLSRIDFEVCDIVACVAEVLERNGVSADLVRIEVTENAFMDNPDLIKEAVERFHELGLQVWMDDFGSGYSSLNVMREYEFDVIKIDMNFLRGLATPEMERRSHIMLEHVVDMGKQLGLQTLTEGVEDEEQLQFLKLIGCEKIQGYVFAKPAPLEEMIARIESGEFRTQNPASRPFFDAVGRLNLAHPVDNSAEDPTGVASGLPVAVLEYGPTCARYLMANAPYIEAIKQLGIDGLKASERLLAEVLGSDAMYGIPASLPRAIEAEGWVPVRYHAGQIAAAGYMRRITQDASTGNWAVMFFALGQPRFPD